uniref:Response regulator n=1 Tax=Candidatus Desulfatibia profunda TaxID=2841695 RepID=A0A8J6TN77_9BACT|nr:response regulator [Candidatus Desulfatibia profunda]
MHTLLLIDDEEGVRRSVARALKREPYQTHTAANGEAGINFIKNNKEIVATVISDYKMPGLNGLETLAIIGSINPEITRIILTGYATMEAAIQATNDGIDGFLTKPFDNLELRAKIHKISVRRRLKQFVSEQVYKKIEKSPIALHPSFHEVSILFSDIRGFTRMSRKVPAKALAAFLNNDYFTPMGEIAYAYNGTVDKHIGDGIMVVFGAPVEHEDDTIRAVQAAVAMQQKAKEIDRKLGDQNGLSLKIGIGISTGSVFSGILGSLRIKQYTSIGMPVNIAARLQDMAKAGEILICNTTFRKLAGKIDVEALPPVTIKGLNEPITVYRVKI